MKTKRYKVLISFIVLTIISSCLYNVKALKYSTYINNYPVTSYTEDITELKNIDTLNDGEMDVKKSVEYNDDGTFNVSLMAEGKKFITNLTDESEYNIVFVLDNSGSMYNTPSRITGSTNAINEIIRNLSEYSNINIGVVAYGSKMDNQPAGSLPADVLLNLGHYTSTSSSDKFIECISTWDSSQSSRYSEQYFLDRCLKVVTSQNDSRNGFIFSTGGTFTQAGIIKGYELLNQATNKNSAKPIIILMSDGEATGMTWTKGGDLHTDYQWEIKSVSDLMNNYDSGTFGAEYFTTNSIMPYVSIRTAMYVKDLINSEYNKKCNFYTFGYDVSPTYYYAISTLNPTKSNIDNLKNFMSSGSEKYGLYELVYNSGLSWDDLMYTDGYYSNADGKTAAEIYQKILFEDSRAENSAVKSGSYFKISDTVGDGMEISQSNGTINMNLNLNGSTKSISLTSNDTVNYSYKDDIVEVKYSRATNNVELNVLGDYFIDTTISLSFNTKLKESSLGEVGGKKYYTNSTATYSFETSKYNTTYKGATVTNNIETTGSITLSKLPAKVYVKYVDESGNNIADTEVINGYALDKYTTSEKEIDGYTLYSKPYNASGTMTEEDIEVIYKYKVLSKDEPNVSIDKTANWVDIENGIAKVTLKEKETVEEKVDTSDYLIVYDVSGSMPIVTVNNYEPGTYNVNINEVYNIGCKNPNHYSKLKPGYSDDLNGWRNAYHYDNNGTPNDTSDDILLNYTSNKYEQKNWNGDVVQTFYLSEAKDFMYSKEKGCYSTLDTSQKMINKFVDEVLTYDANAKFGYVSFGGDVVKTNDFTSGENLKKLVNNSTQYGGTTYVPPLKKAEEILSGYTGNKKVKVIFITDGDNYDENATTEIQKYADNMRNKYGAEIYAVSVDYNASTSSDIRNFGDKYIYLTSDNIDNVVSQFIDYSLNRDVIKATDKVYTDKVNSEYFEVINTEKYPLPEDTTLSNEEITWNIPANTSNKDQEYQTSFYIKLKDEYRKTADDTMYKTNLDSGNEYGAKLTYKISGGYYNSQTRTLSKETSELPYGLEVINATKAWIDYENSYNTRPQNVTLKLNKNGVQVDSAQTQNTYSFPGYKEENGNIVVYGLKYDNDSNSVDNTYTITEENVDNYKNTQTGNKNNSYIITNTLDMQSSIKVKYVDTDGNELLAEDTVTGKVGTDYKTTRKNIENYRAHGNDPENATGKFKPEEQVVTYVYEKIPATLKVNYIDKYSNNVIDTIVINGFVGESKKTSAKDISGYVLIESPEKEEYVLTENEQVVNYYYAKQSKVIVKYIDENTGAQIPGVDEVTNTYKQGENYTTEKKDISNYTYTKDTGNTTGTVADKDIDVVYYYKKNSAGVVTKHIDTVTKKEIAKSTTQTGLENDNYTTSSVTIDGYVLEITPANAIGKMTPEQITVTYEYRKLSNVIVKYVDENTGAEIPGVDEITTTYKQGESYTTEKKDISNYTYTKDTGNTTGTVVDKDIEVVYYYKKNSAGVVTKHIDTVTKKEIAKSTTQTGLENEDYTTSSVTIDGYVLEVIPDNATGKFSTSEIVVTYEYRKLSSVIVKYIDENTGIEIPGVDEITTTYKQGKNYTTEKKDIPNYTYTKDTGNVSGTVADKDIEVVYYYKKNSAGVVTKHIDTVTKKEIAKSTTQTGLENEDYTTRPVTIDGYVLEVTPSNATGKFSTSEIVVTYEYRKLSNVIVKYIDENTGIEIPGVDEITTTYKQGENYTTEKKEISGYTYTKDTENVSGTVVDKDIEVIYYYKKNSAGVITKHIDTVTKKEIAKSTTQTGLENEDYTTSPVIIDGYVLEVTPDNATGKFSTSEIVVTYEYRKQSNVIVKYVDENSGKEITDKVSTTYKQGESYITEKKKISGYTYTKDTGNTTGTVADKDIEVVYYYKKNSAGVVTKYIDQVTKEEISASKSQTGLENDDYTTTEVVVPGYELVLTPANATGKMTPEQITVTYEYRKQSNVTVKYVDENTGKELLGQVTTTYKQGDPYTTEKKAIDGYTYTKDTGNVSGTVERENIEVVYYYKRNTKVVVKYIDEVTKEEIIDSVEITGLEKDPYETEEKEKAGYELVGVDGNTTGKMTVDPIEVTYKYRKNANLITKHIDKNSGEKIVEDVVKKYKEGDKYEALPQNIAGYVLVESPEETTGTMGRENVEKTFYYKKISEGLVVKYVDKITGELLDIEEYTGNENDLITFDEKTFLHYVIYSRPDVSEARLTPEAQEYTYYYVREAKVNVRGIDQDTKEVLYETTMSGLEGNEYTTEPRKVDGYELVKIPQNKDGVYSRNTQDVVYEYKKISGGVTVKYLDKETGEEVADEERITGYVGDTYQTEKKEVEDYNFVEVKGDAIGSLEAEEKEVIYYYEKKTGKVEVIYEDREGNVLLKEEMTGKVKEKYKVEEKEIKNYKIVERPEQTEGEYKEGTIILKYILEKKQGRITVNFVDKEGNKLAESITTEGYVEESYELEAPEIEGYKVIKNGQIKTEYTEEEQIIDVVYEKEEIPATGDIPVNIFIIVFGISLLGLTIHLKKCKQ